MLKCFAVIEEILKENVGRFDDLPEKTFARLNQEFAEARINAKELFGDAQVWKSSGCWVKQKSRIYEL